MKRIGLVVWLLLSWFSITDAQEPSGLEVLLSSGAAFPSTPMTFSNYWKMQYGGSVGIGMPLSSAVALVGSVEFYRFGMNESGVRRRFDPQYLQTIWLYDNVILDPSADPSTVLTVSANLRIAPVLSSRVVSPYVLIGSGIMNISLKEISLPVTSTMMLNNTAIAMTAEQKITGGTQTTGFLQGGLGFAFNVSPDVIPFLEVRYVVGFTEGISTAYVPITAGARIGL